jgi:hypothetical protein
MKKLFLLCPLCFMGCASVQWVQTDHGRVVSEHGQTLNIVGNPRLTCYKENALITDGYFVRQTEEGTFLIDEFGKRFVLIENPVCRVNSNESPQTDKE